MRRPVLTAIAITAFAIPTVALASNGADDTTRTTSTSSTTTTSTTATPKRQAHHGLTAAQRTRAIAAARARVGDGAKVVSVKRNGGAIRVRLTLGAKRYDVRVSLAGDVRSVKAKHFDDAVNHDAGNDNGVDDPATHDAGDDDSGSGHGGSGHGGDDA